MPPRSVAKSRTLKHTQVRQKSAGTPNMFFWILHVCAVGVRIRQEKGLVSLGKTEDIKIYRDKKGALKIMANSIDFVAKSVTVSCV